MLSKLKKTVRLSFFEKVFLGSMTSFWSTTLNGMWTSR